MRIIYVASEPRAGSTFLQLLLATHPQIVGLGEIVQVIYRARLAQSEAAKSPPCSCGAAPEACPFWASLLPDLLDTSPHQAHAKIRAHFAAQFPAQVMVDSSKTMAPLTDFYLKAPDAAQMDVRVLYVIRDFRGWVPSVHKHRRDVAGWNLEETPPYLRASVEKFRRDKRSLRHGYVQDAYRWMRRTQSALRSLEALQVPHLIVSYEELVFNTAGQTRRIGEFLGMSFNHDLSDLSSAVAHELYGSPILKTDKVKRAKIFYDHQWLRDLRPSLLAPLLGPVLNFNRSIYTELADSPPRNVARALPPFQPDFVPRALPTP